MTEPTPPPAPKSGTGTRVAAAAVGLGILVPALFFGGVWAVVAAVVIGGFGCLFEYSRMAFKTVAGEALPWLLVGAVVLAGCAGWADRHTGIAVMALFLAALLVRCTLWPGEELSGAADRMGRFVLGIVWIGGLFPLLIHIRMVDEGARGVWWVVLTLAASWLGDTGAYFAGRAFGSRKLYARISPKKTWEGFWGGVVAVTLGVIGLKLTMLPELGWPGAIGLGLVASTAGVLGDLAESLLKRSFGVKDAGSILPGHGGFFDRVDSVLFVAPVVYSYMVWTGAVGG